MEKYQFKGWVSQQKIIKAQDPTLVLFKIRLVNHPINPNHQIDQEMTSLIAKQALTFLLQVQVGDLVIIYGHYNNKGQFITEKYLVQEKIPRPEDQLLQQYPHKKPD